MRFHPSSCYAQGQGKAHGEWLEARDEE